MKRQIRNIEENSFAAACYDQNTVDDLRTSLQNGPDLTDMKNWNLTAEQWKEQIEIAIENLESEAE